VQRRIIGLVEIVIDQLAAGRVFGRGGIDEARGGIGFLAAGQVAKHDEEAAGSDGFDLETKILPVQCERQ
jgi:hypothetical protein